ncbi:MAG: hypothetical protein KF796_19210 [Ramlibacter sp.]|nr:hypothetical protein [Ramlibacter sp.]
MIYETPELQKAFEQGVAAAATGQRWAVNPYPQNSLRAVTWANGYNHAPARQPAPLVFAPGVIERHVPPAATTWWRVLLAFGLVAVLAFLVGAGQ